MGEVTDAMRESRIPSDTENLHHSAELEDRIRTADRKSSAEIHRDIQRTRADMDETLTYIRRRLEWGELATDAFTVAREKWVEKSPDVVGVVKRNPGPLALLASSIGWMIYRGTSHEGEQHFKQQMGEKISEKGEQIGEKAQQFGEKAREAVGSFKEKTAEKMGSLKHRTSEAFRQKGQSARLRASETSERLTEGTRQAAIRSRERFAESLQSNPLAVGAMTLAAGAVCGLALPLTSQEEQLISRATEDIREGISQGMSQASSSETIQGENI